MAWWFKALNLDFFCVLIFMLVLAWSQRFWPSDYGVCGQYNFLFFLWNWLTVHYKLLEWNMDDIWSAWLISADTQSPYQETCSTWVIFPNRLLSHGEIKDIFNWFLVFISCRSEWIKKWLTAPSMPMSFHIGHNVPIEPLEQVDE